MFRGRLRKGLHPSVVRHITEPYLRGARAELPHHLDIHRAHVIMLAEQQILTREEAGRILEGLSELDHTDIYAGEMDVGTDLYMNVEEQLIRRVGDVGGKMHIGRSRNDVYATSVRMETRKQILTTAAQLLDLLRVVLSIAEVHAETVMPGYTHWQHAQPVTLGHYLAGIAQALERDLGRLIAAYERTNSCPLGAAALATTGFQINRERVAFLLGFDRVLENSYDAVASRDFLAEVAAALAILMTTLSRLAEDLAIWNTFEFSVVRMPEEFAATSSIMPQKKNPIVLEHIKGRAGHVIGALTSVLAVLKGTSFSHSRETGGETSGGVQAAFGLVQGCVEMLTELFPRLSFDGELMRRRAGEGFSTVTELADLLVRRGGVSFRQAHHILGQVVNELMDKSQGVGELSSAMIDQAARAVVGRGFLLPEEEVRRALDPLANVMARDICGGPGPRAMAAAIEAQREVLERAGEKLSSLAQGLERARAACREAQSHLTSGIGRG